nr:reverse transcriptase domain-containing protein [Tanacetum cinerariifolium]
MDEEPMWAADSVVALTPGFAITIPESAKEFAIKALFDRLLGEIRAFFQHENKSITDAWLRMKEMLRNCHGHNLSKGNIIKIFYHSLNETTQEVLNAAASGIFFYKTPNQAYQLLEDNDPPVNPNDQPNDSKTRIKFDSNDEDEEPTPQPKPKEPKPIKETPIPKPYKPKILYPQRPRKEKMEAQHGKFLDMIQAVRSNVPFVDVLVGMPNYGKFLKELISNKHKIKKISAAFLSDESFAILQNKVPPKHRDLESFLIPCNFNKSFSCNALADLGASINLILYSLYAKLSLETLKPTKMSEEDSKVLLILERPFLHTTDAAIRVKHKQINLKIGTKRMILNIDYAMKYSYPNDDTCFSIDVINEILAEDFDALLNEEKLFAEFDEFMAMAADENSDSDTEEPPFKKITFNTAYKIKTSLEEPPIDLELKPLTDNLEYAFLDEPFFLSVIISS